jgi:aryl carrier-like protein
MVPAAFLFLDALPLTLNGKVDRKALPAPTSERPNLEQDYAAPRTAHERTLAAIWEEVLDVRTVGIHDNFFALGGDSIKSIQILARAQAKGLRLSLESLFANPTVADLAKCPEAETRATASEPYCNLSNCSAQGIKRSFRPASRMPIPPRSFKAE